MLKFSAGLLFIFLFVTFPTIAQLLDSTALSNKTIYTLEEALLFPEQVYKLSLKKTKPEQFPDLQQFKNLQWLCLSRNKLTEIPEQVFYQMNLQYLDLSKNKIDLIPKEIGNLINIKQLYLHQNNIASLPPQISQLINLELIDLWDNEISVLPDEIKALKNLKRLDLRNIQINDNEQKKISSLLPETKIFFSPACNCKY